MIHGHRVFVEIIGILTARGPAREVVLTDVERNECQIVDIITSVPAAAGIVLVVDRQCRCVKEIDCQTVFALAGPGIDPQIYRGVRHIGASTGDILRVIEPTVIYCRTR